MVNLTREAKATTYTYCCNGERTIKVTDDSHSRQSESEP